MESDPRLTLPPFGSPGTGPGNRRRRPRASLGSAVARMLVTLGAICLGAGATAGDGAPAPFPVSLIDPRTGDAVELRPGAPLLHLVFFATWCPPCRDELPRLTELDTRWGNAGYRLVVVAVAARQSTERLREFVDSANIGGEVLFDSTGDVQKKLGATQLPTHVVVDERGTVLVRAPSLSAEVESVIESVMAERMRRSGR